VIEVANEIRVLICRYVKFSRDGAYDFNVHLTDKLRCNRAMRELLSSLVMFSKANDARRIVLQSPSKFINTYIESRTDFSGKVSLTYKSRVIAELLGTESSYRMHIGGALDGYKTRVRGILIDQDLETEAPTVSEPLQTAKPPQSEEPLTYHDVDEIIIKAMIVAEERGDNYNMLHFKQDPEPVKFIDESEYPYIVERCEQYMEEV